MSVKAQRLAYRYGKKTDIIEIIEDIIDEQNRVSAFLNPVCPIVTNRDEIQAFQWGLIPYWVKSRTDANKLSKMTLNARSETVFQKPAYRYPIQNRRCLIPATGYFEFHYERGKVDSGYFIFLKDTEIFSMAGIYDRWEDSEFNEKIYTFSQITTRCNQLTEFIHNGGKNPFRMPVILRKEDEEKWVNPNTPLSEIKELMKPFDANLMDAYRVRKDFYLLDSKDPEILKPL